ncbi:unnamed protein product [Lactuca saligna]|uniref:Uncharacterized protein n=1 Tax=Lactuca saligna TaxID=75948 RepID=A0AA36ENU7_LACSI|nr:unnamed protein product [Lactuca saligna]
MEEEETSKINANLSNEVINVNMGDGSFTISINTTAIPPPSSPLVTSMLIPTSIPGISPTFQEVMQEHITSFFHRNQQNLRSPFMITNMKMISWLATYSHSFDSKLMKLQDATCERHVIFENMVIGSKDSIELKVNVLMGTMTCLVEDLTTFNKDYSRDLKLKNEGDGKMFDKIEKNLTEFKRLSQNLIFLHNLCFLNNLSLQWFPLLNQVLSMNWHIYLIWYFAYQPMLHVLQLCRNGEKGGSVRQKEPVKIKA